MHVSYCTAVCIPDVPFAFSFRRVSILCVFQKSAEVDLLTAVCVSSHLLPATYHIKDVTYTQTHRSISLVVITSFIGTLPFLTQL